MTDEKKEKILIIEDDEFLASLYKELLTEEGYVVNLVMLLMPISYSFISFSLKHILIEI